MTKPQRICTMPDCDQPLVLLGKWCKTHYDRWRRHGDPAAVVQKRAKKGEGWRFLTDVLEGVAPREPNGCILWPYGRTSKGYARISSLSVGAAVLERFDGPRPTEAHTIGHALHDVCGNRHCVAPEHLSWQSSAEQWAHRQMDGTAFPLAPTTGGRFSGIPDETVRGAVARVRGGEPKAQVARDLGVSWKAVHSWVSGRNRQEAMG